MEILLIAVIVLVLVFGFVVFRGAPYVPTRRRDLEKAFTEVYPLSDKDVVVDIGSGDGVVLRQAAQRGARAVGYELNPVLVLISRLISRNYGDRISIRLADFWFVSLPSDTTLVYTFGESRDIKKMYRKVVSEATRLQKPLFFMSYGFTVQNQQTIKSDGAIHLYRVDPLQEL